MIVSTQDIARQQAFNAGHSHACHEAYNSGYVAGMAHMETEAEMKFDLGVIAGLTAVANELGDLTLIEPTRRAKKGRR